MTCEEIDPELVGYHFAELEPEARAAVEAHLVGCPSCTRSFVDLKRAIELQEGAARPSDAARARLRRAVVAELAGPRGAPRRWWERPLAVAVAASLVLAASASTRLLTARPGRPPLALAAAGR
jgi:anti-sigma factor RsiW